METLVHIYADCSLSAGSNLKSPEAHNLISWAAVAHVYPPPTSARDELWQDFLHSTVYQ